MCISNKKKESLISQEYLKFLFDYDAETGDLIWRVSNSNRIKVGQVAGTLHNKGYVRIKIDGKRYFAHRLVWVWHHGIWPEQLLDHINRQKDDNRIENLRDVSQTENMRHSKIRTDNSSGHCGVLWNKASCKWQVSIRVNSKLIHLGFFTDINEAVRVRKQAEAYYGFSPFHGNTAPLPNVVLL